MVGILTFHFAQNFGAVLQAYALKEYLQKITNEKVEIINYVGKNIPNIGDFKISNIKGFHSFFYYFIEKKQNELFRKFLIENLGIDINKRSSSFELLSKSYSKLIVGSDQVWNQNITNNDDNYFFPNSSTKKISYSASFGNFSLNNCFSKLVYLQTFDSIAVREDSAVQYLKKNLPNQTIIKTCDPVFLLDAKEWQLLAHQSKHKLPTRKYILCYLLFPDVDLTNLIHNLSISEKLDVIAINPANRNFTQSSLSYPIGPIEFLSLINNATYVVTNSFHGVAFCSIFQKKVYVNSCSKKDDRIFNITKLYANVETQIKFSKIDFNCDYPTDLVKLIQCSKDYLSSFVK